MSDYLLQKSCKLLLEGKHIKKTKKSEKQRLKKKKNLLKLKEIGEKEFETSILRNLNKLEELSQQTVVIVSEKVLAKCVKKVEKEGDQEEEEEKSTVFTDKDFEDFEKEYFGS